MALWGHVTVDHRLLLHFSDNLHPPSDTISPCCVHSIAISLEGHNYENEVDDT
jgi:hypothetical protein